jgi:hypothetical protein
MIFFRKFKINLIYFKGAKVVVANRITQATPTCFFIAFMVLFGKYFKNILGIFFKNLQKTLV